MTEHLTPICEPQFSVYGTLFVAHVVPHEWGAGCYEVTVYEMTPHVADRVVWYGTYGKRLVSYEMATVVRNRAEAAIRREVAG